MSKYMNSSISFKSCDISGRLSLSTTRRKIQFYNDKENRIMIKIGTYHVPVRAILRIINSVLNNSWKYIPSYAYREYTSDGFTNTNLVFFNSGYYYKITLYLNYLSEIERINFGCYSFSMNVIMRYKNILTNLLKNKL